MFSPTHPAMTKKLKGGRRKRFSEHVRCLILRSNALHVYESLLCVLMNMIIFKLMCFVLGSIDGCFATAKELWLSSNTVHLTIFWMHSISNARINSFIMFVKIQIMLIYLAWRKHFNFLILRNHHKIKSKQNKFHLCLTAKKKFRLNLTANHCAIFFYVSCY